MICPYCNNQAEWVENKEIYGRNYGKSYMCYYCKEVHIGESDIETCKYIIDNF